ncbi:TIGR01741 family protein [Staphylococcus argenteus]|uniref:TIGR01741 family protein n=1 Tax=Staphylococcus argenteus TaxID=985002 RepID=UPI001FB9F85C|nr:TIGR01741 family protein [Staphylococcus argenteus]GJF85003.1 TIGR01741 family protein [Staphylococcus argenteus]
MTFEEKLSELYNEIANEISGMIPVEWEKVYTIAYVDNQGGEVIFNYTKPGSEELNYYSDIPKDCNVSNDIFMDLWMKVYRIENYYMYKKFGVIPEMEYEMEEVKQIEQYIKEQEEAEQ